MRREIRYQAVILCAWCESAFCLLAPKTDQGKTRLRKLKENGQALVSCRDSRIKLSIYDVLSFKGCRLGE